MAINMDEVEGALGAIGAAANRPVRRLSPKLSSVEAGSVEGFYMLATFCFDLQRKLEYVCKANLDYISRMDPELAREIVTDNETIGADGLSWRERAERAEEIMLRLHREIGAQHEQGLQQALGG
jgi:hypothetical protein